MPADRTFVTEIATALGMLGDADLDAVLARQPSEMANLADADWERLRGLRTQGLYDADFAAGFANGLAFLGEIEGILAVEEEHADHLLTLLKDLGEECH